MEVPGKDQQAPLMGVGKAGEWPGQLLWSRQAQSLQKQEPKDFLRRGGDEGR